MLPFFILKKCKNVFSLFCCGSPVEAKGTLRRGLSQGSGWAHVMQAEGWGGGSTPEFGGAEGEPLGSVQSAARGCPSVSVSAPPGAAPCALRDGAAGGTAPGPGAPGRAVPRAMPGKALRCPGGGSGTGRCTWRGHHPGASLGNVPSALARAFSPRVSPALCRGARLPFLTSPQDLIHSFCCFSCFYHFLG